MNRQAWFRKYGGYYATNGYSFPPWAIYEQFLRVVETPGPILELGCGNGLLLRYLHDLSGHHLSPYGADINESAIREARSHVFPERAECFICADLRDGVPYGQTFSTILANPIHADRGYQEQVDGKIQKLYLDGAVEALVGRCWRAVSPGGRLVLWCYDGHIAEIADYHDALNASLAGAGVSLREFESGPVNYWVSERKTS